MMKIKGAIPSLRFAHFLKSEQTASAWRRFFKSLKIKMKIFRNTVKKHGGGRWRNSVFGNTCKSEQTVETKWPFSKNIFEGDELVGSRTFRVYIFIRNKDLGFRV